MGKMKLGALLCALSVTLAAAADAADPSPGFYPGAATPVFDQVAYKAFLERHKQQIQEIAAAIIVLRANPQARGCVGTPVIGCVASLAQVYALASAFAPDSSEHEMNGPLDEPRVDINGKAIAPMPLELWLHSSDRDYAVSRTVRLEPDASGVVRKVRVKLASDPFTARTFDEYEQTGVYEAALASMAGACDLPDRTTFYRIIENKMKPLRETETLVGGASFTIATARLCGVIMQIETSVARDETFRDKLRVARVTPSFSVEADPNARPAATAPSGPRLGIEFLNLPPEIGNAMNRPGLKGVFVVRVEPQSAADRAGLKAGDVVTLYDGHAIAGISDLQSAVHAIPGATANLTAVRNGVDTAITVQF
jgi:hypothetical protein